MEWKVGDRVLANFTQDHIAGRLTYETSLTQLGAEIQGLLGEYFIFPKTGVVKIPNYLSFEEASCLPCAALTAWNALYGLIPIRPGQVVLLQSTGGVSTFGLQIAHAAGATTIVTSSSDGKLAKAKELGATHTINYRGQACQVESSKLPSCNPFCKPTTVNDMRYQLVHFLHLPQTTLM